MISHMLWTKSDENGLTICQIKVITYPKYKCNEYIPPYNNHHVVFHWKAYLRSYIARQLILQRLAANDDDPRTFSKLDIAKYIQKICRYFIPVNLCQSSGSPLNNSLLHCSVLPFPSEYVGQSLTTGVNTLKMSPYVNYVIMRVWTSRNKSLLRKFKQCEPGVTYYFSPLLLMPIAAKGRHAELNCTVSANVVHFVLIYYLKHGRLNGRIHSLYKIISITGSIAVDGPLQNET